MPRDAASGPGPVGNQSGTEPQCFVAGTLVLTTKGKQAIESLKPGDRVLSWDEETGEVIERQVTEWYRREAPVNVDIFVGVEKISCTLDHPFWVNGKGWVRASQLKSGMVLRGRKGEHLTIDIVRRRDEVTQVHNVEIDGLHTYFVSQLEILSHNMCGGTGSGLEESLGLNSSLDPEFEDLKKSLASEDQMSQPGGVMAVAGSATPLRKAQDLADTYGGSPEDWVHKYSSSFNSAEGTHVETHWFEVAIQILRIFKRFLIQQSGSLV